MSQSPSKILRSPFGVGAGRAANEYFPTPLEATRALLHAEQFDGSIWETGGLNHAKL